MLVLYNDKLPIEERAREIELTIAYEVSVESDESGKKIYSNDILRNAEARKRLQSDIEYESLKEQLDFLEKEERNLKTEIDILDRKFRIIEQMVAPVMVRKLEVALNLEYKNLDNGYRRFYYVIQTGASDELLTQNLPAA